MEHSLSVQLIDADSGDLIDQIQMDQSPHPGHPIQMGDRSFLVLEKRHCYHLRAGRYHLHRIRAYVRSVTEIEPEQGVIGDPSCLYNARTPLLRCAVHPLGPCQGCPDYVLRDPFAPWVETD